MCFLGSDCGHIWRIHLCVVTLVRARLGSWTKGLADDGTTTLSWDSRDGSDHWRRPADTPVDGTCRAREGVPAWVREESALAL